MNDANLLDSMTYTTKAQQPFKITYDYRKNGNITQSDENGQVSNFVYDANDQLIKETLPNRTIKTYDYDAVGNRTAFEVNGKKATFTYNDANQIATKNETAYTYDADGNLLQDENYKYTYNQQQRLTKTVVKVKDTVTEYRSYEWSGYTPLGMMVKAKNEVGTFETKAHQFSTNHRGDVLSIRDKDDKEVGAYIYDADGNELSATGTLAKANLIRYASYYYDDEPLSQNSEYVQYVLIGAYFAYRVYIKYEKFIKLHKM